MASCRVWQPFAVSWVCVPGPARSTHGGDRTAGNCGRGEEIRRRVFAAAPCNIPVQGSLLISKLEFFLRWYFQKLSFL